MTAVERGPSDDSLPTPDEALTFEAEPPNLALQEIVSEADFLPDGGVVERDLRRAPLLIYRDTERNQRIRELPRLAGTETRYDPETGTIFYSRFRERVRVLKPEIYATLSRLPTGWSTGRMLRAATRRPLMEQVFVQIRKDKGSVETAIRAVGHILDGYKIKNGVEVVELRLIRGQISRALNVLSQFPSQVHPQEFEQAFEELHGRTIEILGGLKMQNKTLQIKRQLADQAIRGTKGKDRLGRRNPMAMLKILDSALEKVERRQTVFDLIRAKYKAMGTALLDERRRGRAILTKSKGEMYPRGMGVAGHGVFRFPERGTTDMQKGILQSRLRGNIRGLRRIKLKPYRPIAREAISHLNRAIDLIEEGKFQEAGFIFQRVYASAREVLEEFRTIKKKEE